MSDSDNNSVKSNEKSPNNKKNTNDIEIKLNDESNTNRTNEQNNFDNESSLSASNSGKSELNRKKVILGPGYSLMDWIRLGRQTPDLAGTQGMLRMVTLEELAKHNKKNDCWLAIYDKVYNVTPYMKFHPGGVDGWKFFCLF
jgi:cytochrome b involved in lipid metabolism